MDPATAALGASRDFAAIERPGVPDGSVIDAEGFLWNAQWGGAKLARYSPDGMVSSTFGLPVSQPTCLCFGGESFDWLFVSTATEGLSEAQLRKEPEAGNVLIYRTAFRGLPEDRFRP
jgi:L-arabinonolactonase